MNSRIVADAVDFVVGVVANVHITFWAERQSYTIHESTYEPKGFLGGGHGAYHPMAWYHTPFPKVRSWYTALGHYPKAYYDEDYRKHVLGGTLWVLGMEDIQSETQAEN